MLRRFTACIGRGRELGNRDSLIAIKNCAENDAIVPVLIEMGMLQPNLRRTVPSILGSCLVYKLTAGAQALAIDQSMSASLTTHHDKYVDGEPSPCY